KDEKGEINQLIVTQNGQELKGKKLKEETIIQLKPEILDNYVGKYKLNENTIVIVTRESNRLFAEPTGEPKVEMLAVSETDFVIMMWHVYFNVYLGVNYCTIDRLITIKFL